MKVTKIKVNNVSYPVKFGYGAIRLLGGIWGMNGFVPVVEKVGGMIPEGKDFELSFDNLDTIGDIIWAGIVNAAKEDETDAIDRTDTVDAFFADMSSIAQIFELFMQSMPKGNQKEGKPKPRKSGKK